MLCIPLDTWFIQVPLLRDLQNGIILSNTLSRRNLWTPKQEMVHRVHYYNTLHTLKSSWKIIWSSDERTPPHHAIRIEH